MDAIYLDNAATTPVDPAVVNAMLPFFSTCYGNASSVHSTGRDARKAVENARRQVAAALNADPSEIFFTSGGTESDNWALTGAVPHGAHVVTSAVEHHAVLHACARLQRDGRGVTILPVDGEGRIKPEDVAGALRPETALVSVMLANNEIGTIEPVRALADAAHAGGALFHTDAVQAVGAIPVDVQALGCDLLSLSAHKFRGPKGVGALYIRRGTRLPNLMEGGAQERGHRPGTENVAGIVGLGCALTLAMETLAEKAARVAALRDRLEQGLLARVPDTRRNGPAEGRLPNNCSLSFNGIEGESLLLRLDLAGVAASSGSACTSGSVDPSHVLMAIGRTREEAQGSLRLTLGSQTTEEEIDRVLEILPPIVEDLRSMRIRR